MSQLATHRNPVWGDKSDFIIRADLSPFGMPGEFEQIWARKITENRFEICCIPFFTYGLALGDEVTSTLDFVICNVQRRNGHKIFRIAIETGRDTVGIHKKLHEWVDQTGFLYEWSSDGYLAVDVPPEVLGIQSDLL